MLFSIGQFYDAGMTVTFKKSTLKIRNECGTEILKRTGNGSNGMWSINMETLYKRENKASSVYVLRKKKGIIALPSQAMWNPVPITGIKTMEAGFVFLHGWD